MVFNTIGVEYKVVYNQVSNVKFNTSIQTQIYFVITQNLEKTQKATTG